MSGDLTRHRSVLSAAQSIDPAARLLPPDEAQRTITLVLGRFRPWRVSGHLSVSSGSNARFEMQTEQHELTFSHHLDRAEEPAVLFFEQDARDRDRVIVLSRLGLLSDVMSEADGCEYFVSDCEANFLISVNWYVIAGVGNIAYRAP